LWPPNFKSIIQKKSKIVFCFMNLWNRHAVLIPKGYLVFVLFHFNERNICVCGPSFHLGSILAEIPSNLSPPTSINLISHWFLFTHISFGCSDTPRSHSFRPPSLHLKNPSVKACFYRTCWDSHRQEDRFTANHKCILIAISLWSSDFITKLRKHEKLYVFLVLIQVFY